MAGTLEILKTGCHLRWSLSRNRKRSRKSAYDIVKIKNRFISGVISATELESEESERFHFLMTLLMTPSFGLRSSENQIVGLGSKRGSIKQSQFTFPRSVIGLVRLLLLATPTTQFSLDRKRRTLSVAREKQPSHVLI